MGAYDGAEVCDIVGLFLLSELEKLTSKIYRQFLLMEKSIDWTKPEQYILQLLIEKIEALE